MKVLYINSCIRNTSRTKILADYLLKKIGGEVKEIVLTEEKLAPIDDDFLQKRETFISECNFNDDIFSYAKDFVSADTIVVVAPYWDLSFPSVLKVFLEHIKVLK